MLGFVWSLYVGPTLGAASTLTSQGCDLGQTTLLLLLLLLFGLGAGTPLLAIGSASRSAFTRTRGRLLALGQRGRWVLGAVCRVAGQGLRDPDDIDKRFEAWAVKHSPDWPTRLTTRF